MHTNPSTPLRASGSAVRPLADALRLGGDRPLVVLCLGSDRVLYDCAGPLVGTLLTTHFALPAFVYGTLGHPVHALNLCAALSHIARRHPFARVLCVDACLGRASDIGRLSVVRGGIAAGAAAGKRLPLAGDTGLTLTVGSREHNGADARLGLIYALAFEAAQTIARVIGEAYSFPVTNIG